jgi:hypothetical protein
VGAHSWLLLLLPYRRLTIDTAIPAGDAMRQIRGASNAGLDRKRVFRARCIDDKKFKFKVVLVAFRGFRPVIVGEATPAEFGARVAVTIRMNAIYSSFLVAFFIGLSMLGGLHLAPLVAMAVGLSVGFIFDAARAEALLRALLLPVPRDPSSAPIEPFDRGVVTRGSPGTPTRPVRRSTLVPPR